MSTNPNGQQGQYPPPSWESQPQRGAYPPPPQEGLPAPHPYPQQNPSSGPGEMVTLPPPQSQHPDLYRQPPYDMYQQHPHHMQYQQHPHEPHRDPHAPQINFNQPAPRQRTAIACRYCRRRKIRCHGFDSSPDGRCTNCIRFHQECIFTPVSSQAHAFVPAHTAYPHLRNTGQMQQLPNGRAMYPHHDGPPVIYGAHGQPLGPIPPQGQDPNYGPQGYAPTPYPGVVYDDRGGVAPPHPHDQVSRKRPRLDDSLYPSPISQSEKSSHPYPSQQRLSTASGRRGSGAGGQYEYPDPTGLAPVSPASSTTSYQSAQYPQAPQPYYPPSVRRSPPQPTYSYEGRASTSPHGSTSSAVTYPYYAGLHPPQVLPPAREAGRTPPPATSPESNGSRAGMSVRDMLGPGDGAGGRTSADSDMLNALNKRGM